MKKLKTFLEILSTISVVEPMYLFWAALQLVVGSILPLYAVFMPKLILESLTDIEDYSETVNVILIGCILLLILKLADEILQNRSQLSAGRFAAKLRQEIGRTVMKLPLSDIETAGQRRMIQMANNGARLTEVLDITRQLTANFITIAGLVWTVLKLSWVFIAAVAVVLAISLLFSRLQFEYMRKNRVLSAKNERVGDYLQGLAYFNKGAQKELRVNSLQEWFMTKILGFRGEMVRLQYGDFKRYALFESIMALLLAAQSLSVLLILTESYIVGAISIADFTMYFAAVTALTASLNSVAQQIRNYNEQILNFTDYRKLAKLIDRTEEISDEGEVPKQVEIIFEDVTFTYPGSDKNVLEHLSLTVRAGEKLMLVGRNGSGKTTLIKLLCRLYEPTSGRILLNGQNIADIPLERYYRIVGSVFQDCQLFAFTLAENIAMNETADRERILLILRGLGLEHFAKSLPEGLNTYLTRQFSESGVEISGGQEQKLAIARAVYKDSPLLILDEPTASLDAKAESEIYADFGRMAQGKTTIFISHRLAAASMVEHIALLDDGRVVEEGTHGELISLNGLYAQMYSSQGQAYV